MSFIAGFFAAIFTFFFFAIPITIVMCFRKKWRRLLLPLWKAAAVLATGSMLAFVGALESLGATKLHGPEYWFTGLQLYLSMTWLGLTGFLLWCFTAASPLDPARLWLIPLALPLWMFFYFPWHVVKNQALERSSKYLWLALFTVGWVFLIPAASMIYYLLHIARWPVESEDLASDALPKQITQRPATETGNTIILNQCQKLNIKKLLDVE